MREKDEGRPSSQRRVPEDEQLSHDEEPAPLTSQPLETLRAGYSWIKALESRHRGWHLYALEGFPFTLPTLELAESRVCLVSLAGVYRKGQKPFNTSPGVVPPQLRSMRFRDRGANEDINCVFPLARLHELEEEAFIGECAAVHYSLMGYVPEVEPILETTVKEIIPRLDDQEVDAVVVSGGCALSHQSAGLIQREIEEAGIPTVGVSVCPDITYHLQVPRAVALRFPMGNPFGSSMDASMQSRVLRDALSLLHAVQAPGEIVHLPYEWVKT